MRSLVLYAGCCGIVVLDDRRGTATEHQPETATTAHTISAKAAAFEMKRRDTTEKTNCFR